MNFESIKAGFLSYLEEKLNQGENTEETRQSINSSDISIFMYSNDFKDYLVEEVGADVSIFSKSINEIMKMDFVNGKLVDNSDTNSDSFEKENDYDSSNFMTDALNAILSDENVINTFDSDRSGNLSQNELNVFLEGLTNEQDGTISFDKLAETAETIYNSTTEETSGAEDSNVTGNEDNQNKEEVTEKTDTQKDAVSELLDKAYGNKAVIKALDTDGDGVLSDEEKAKFEEFIKGYDGDISSLTEDDIKKAVSDIVDGKFSYDDKAVEKAEKEASTPEKEAVEETKNQTPEQTGSTNSAAPSSGSGSSSPSGGSYSPASTNTANNATTSPATVSDSMTLEELEKEKTNRANDLKEAQEGVNDVYSGENSAVKSAEEDYDKAREEYDEAVENDDKISDDLKDRRQENLDNIESQEDVIDGLKTDINNKEAQISEQESIISEDESNLKALNSALSELNSQSSDDSEKQAEINTKKAEVQAAIQKAEEKLAADKTQKEEYEGEKEDLETKLDEEQTLLDTYEEERVEIEKEISQNCSQETKDAMKAFNEAKENVTSVKEEELKTAQKAVTDAQTALDDINQQINEKKAEETKKEYSVNTSGQELLDELKNSGGDAWNKFDTLCQSLGMDQDEAAAYITELCESEEWGNGCIDPVIFCAQLCQESGYRADAVGDGGNAVGLGQLWEIAVKEVNRVFGTNYSASDRNDAKKNLEIAILFLKEGYEATGTTEGMLGMYNQGTADKAYNSAAKSYVAAVMSRLG